jgi:hypothetical protein
MAEVAPMPIANEQIDTNANPGDRATIRSAYLRDFSMGLTILLSSAATNQI